MCGPAAVPLVMLAIGTATAGMQYAQQNKMAGMQASQNKANNAYINANAMNQYAQGEEQYQYHDMEAAQKMMEEQRRTRAAEATAVTSAGGNGVAGNSVGAVFNQYQGNAAQYNADVEWNRNASNEELTNQMQGFTDEAQSQDNNLPVPNYPSPFATALQIGGSGLNAYTTYLDNTKSQLTQQAGYGPSSVG